MTLCIKCGKPLQAAEAIAHISCLFETTVVNLNTPGARYDLVVDGRSHWGNPHAVNANTPRELAVTLHLLDLFNEPERVAQAIREMTGKRLACHCAPKLCHAENYAAFCNGTVYAHTGAIAALMKHSGSADLIWRAMPGIQYDADLNEVAYNFAGTIIMRK